MGKREEGRGEITEGGGEKEHRKGRSKKVG